MQREAGFTNLSVQREWVGRGRAHTVEVEAWRHTEHYWRMRAQHEPHMVTMLMFDDTSAFGLPHFGSRDFKSTCQNYRVQMIPWLVEDVSRRRRHYVYMIKHRHTKGANRWYLSLLLSSYVLIHCLPGVLSSIAPFVLRRRVTCLGGAPARWCWWLTIFQKIKTTRILLSCLKWWPQGMHLVILQFVWLLYFCFFRWYDEVLMLYGPVGHTHNGIDACHRTHNQVCSCLLCLFAQF